MENAMNHFFKKGYLIYFLALIAVLLDSSVTAGNAHAQESAEALRQISLSGRQPDPIHSPEDVIRFQLEALAQNDTPYKNAGIELVFRFASPSNKRSTGPFERFVRIVNHPVYQPLINHQLAHYGEIWRNDDGDKAAQLVMLTSPDGERVGYLFTLSKQVGESYEDCWMIDNVILLPKLNEV